MPLGRSAAIDAAEVVQAQVRVAQIRLRLNQLRFFIGERDLRATGIKRPDQARTQAFTLAFQLLPQDGDRFFTNLNFFPVQEQFVKREPHIHRDAICHRLEFVQLLGQDEASDGDLITGRAAGVKIFHHLERCIVILRTELRGLRDRASAIESTGNNGGKIAGVRFELAAPRGLDFFPGDRNFRVLRPRQPDDIHNRVAGRAARERDRGQRNERAKREAKEQCHEFFFTASSFFATKFPRMKPSGVERDRRIPRQKLQGNGANLKGNGANSFDYQVKQASPEPRGLRRDDGRPARPVINLRLQHLRACSQARVRQSTRFRMRKIPIAIIGVGNCASSLVQGISFYGGFPPTGPASA